MFSNMMKNNSHRVDYLNFKAIGMDDSFGIYVRGCLKEDQPYSIEAKRRLFTCLDYARQQLDEEKLVAVYMDIIDLKKSKNLAFQEMDADLKKGLFEKVLFADLEEIFADSELNEKIISLSESVEGIEFLDVQGNVFEAKKISLNQIIGV
jgi:hypothetical protein